MPGWLDYKYTPQVFVVTLVIVALASYRYFAYHDTYSADSYVSANVINVAAIVSGPISAIHVVDNQHVKQGQPLISIDKRPYRYALDHAIANLHLAEKNLANQHLLVKVRQQQLDQAQLNLTLYRNHYQRYQRLVAKKEFPELKLIDLSSKIHRQEAQVDASKLALSIAKKNIDESPVHKAQSELQQAQYLYDHTVIKAPVDGVITNFNLRRGQVIKQHKGLFALIDTKKWWVVTRYRETELRLVHPGDTAIITLYMYPGKKFKGHVESIGWGINRRQAGHVSESTLAYLKATEDWIKIAQRFPVRIVFDELDSNYPLRIGASATSKTYTKQANV